MDNILKALMLCRDTKGVHVELANPHYFKMPNGQMVAFASDAHTMLICKNVEGFFDKYDFEPTVTPNIATAIPTEACNQELVVSRLCETFAQVPTLPYIWQECKECDGCGEVTWGYKSHTRLFDCPECNGKGLIKAAGESRDESYAISLGGHQFKVCDIEKLINVFNLLGIETMPMVASKAVTKFENADYILLATHIIPSYERSKKSIISYE